MSLKRYSIADLEQSLSALGRELESLQNEPSPTYEHAQARRVVSSSIERVAEELRCRRRQTSTGRKVAIGLGGAFVGAVVGWIAKGKAR